MAWGLVPWLYFDVTPVKWKPMIMLLTRRNFQCGKNKQGRCKGGQSTHGNETSILWTYRETARHAETYVCATPKQHGAPGGSYPIVDMGLGSCGQFHDDIPGSIHNMMEW